MSRRLLAICAALLALALAPAAAGAAVVPNHVFQREILSPGFPVAEPLKDACGIALDSGDNLFVSSYYEPYVYAFFAGSHFYASRFPVAEGPPGGGGKPGDGPCDLAFDPADELYVNRYHGNVTRYSPTELLGYEPGAVIDSGEATGVAVDPDSGRVFVNSRTFVAVYEPSGAPVMEGGEPLRIGLGGIVDGYGVAVSDFAGKPGFPSTDGRVYVADAAGDVVKVFDPAVDPLQPVEVIDGEGTAQAGFSHLEDTDLAVDPLDGHLYVVDNLQPHVEEPEAVVDEFSSLGHYRGVVPPEVELGQTSRIIHAEPSSLALTGGDLYVSSGNYFDDGDEHGDARVLLFGPTADVATRILGVAKTGAGTGRVFSTSPAGLGCGTACETEITLDRTVVLAAAPAPHNRFAGWTGCQPLPAAPSRCQLVMSEDRAVSAQFEPIPPRSLTVARSGDGSGTVVSAPAGIECGTVCTAELDEGSLVTLTATPGARSRLAGWSGCDSEPGPGSCAVTMSAARAVTASFAAVPDPPPPPPPGQRILSVYPANVGAYGGTVVSAPAGIECGAACAGLFGQGTTVTLVARPAAGSAFLGWGGCDSAAGERCAVTLGTDKSVVAAFGPGSPGPLRLRVLAVERGSAKLEVQVPAGGILSASGPGLRPVTALPFAAGRVALTLRLSAAGRRSLAGAKRQQLGVRVALAFSPFDGGATVRARKTITFGGAGGGR